MSKIYGIDLGTTNSLLGLGDRLLTGLVSSVVNLQTGEAGKEESINKAWDSFFKDKMNLKVESVTLGPSGTRWVVKLIP